MTAKTAPVPPKLRAALRQFHAAFALMSVIPLLTCGYLLAVKLFSSWTIAVLHWIYVVLVMIIAGLGLLYGRRVIEGLIHQLVEANTALERMLAGLERANERLKEELADRKRAEASLHAVPADRKPATEHPT